MDLTDLRGVDIDRIHYRYRATGELGRLLKQWGRWGRESLRYGHCGSTEHKYRSPQCWDAPEPKPPPLDLAEIMAVERAISGQEPLQPKWRYPLVYHYVHRAVERVAIKEIRKIYRVGIAIHHYDQLLYQGEIATGNRLIKIGVI